MKLRKSKKVKRRGEKPFLLLLLCGGDSGKAQPLKWSSSVGGGGEDQEKWGCVSVSEAERRRCLLGFSDLRTERLRRRRSRSDGVTAVRRKREEGAPVAVAVAVAVE